MESFSAIKKRMKSVNDISQMTNAMQLVSSAKMRRSQLLHESMYPFFLFCVESMQEMAQFYLGGLSWIEQCVEEGFHKKDGFDFTPYEEALNG